MKWGAKGKKETTNKQTNRGSCVDVWGGGTFLTARKMRKGEKEKGKEQTKGDEEKKNQTYKVRWTETPMIVESESRSV